ncbi:MAG TPA: acireductone synthase [Thermoanaerobaculia bacterium]|nr:acireductone synthase [Thermoanaerobaculia bacterium]
MFLLDIEGTTTPIAFVTETLFPYARTHLRSYLERHGDSPQYLELLRTFRQEHAADAHARHNVPPWSGIGAEARASVEAYADWLMARDRKSPALKELQGYVWEEGYRNGELVAPVFPDVPRAFERWRTAGTDIGIFSSGSVLAQRWLFRCSSAGDLSAYLCCYFDTNTGQKKDASSYTRIAREVGRQPDEIVFVSDVVAELEAARTAGMTTIMAQRPGNPQQPEHDHQVVASFDEIYSA